MNSNEILPSPNLPDDSSESHGFVTESDGAQRVEKKTNSVGFGTVATNASSSDDSDDQASSQVSLGTAAASSVTQVDVPEDAGDLDLIEKEWVKKAKQIVDDTTGDPHSQSNKINKMKVDYIKKRYNKDIKFKEE